MEFAAGSNACSLSTRFDATSAQVRRHGWAPAMASRSGRIVSNCRSRNNCPERSVLRRIEHVPSATRPQGEQDRVHKHLHPGQLARGRKTRACPSSPHTPWATKSTKLARPVFDQNKFPPNGPLNGLIEVDHDKENCKNKQASIASSTTVAIGHSSEPLARSGSR